MIDEWIETEIEVNGEKRWIMVPGEQYIQVAKEILESKTEGK